MSTEPKWTPGPWSVETVKTSVGSCHKIGPFPGTPTRPENYACVYADRIYLIVHDNLPRSIELRANARVMAAAPDLYEALAKCHAFFVSAGWEREPLSIEVSAALAKARGES